MDKKLLAKLIAGIFGTAPFLAAVSGQAIAAGTDIASSPLANRTSAAIKPNIMLVLDDSGSMMLDYMPESVSGNDPFGPGYRSHLCNTVYYNPTPSLPGVPLSPYLLPRTDTGASLNSGAPASFTAAYDNGYWEYDGVGHNGGVPRMTNLSVDQGYGGYYDTASDPNPGKLASRSGMAAYYWTFVPTDATETNAITPTSAECKLSNIPKNAGNFTAATGVCASTTSAPYNAPYSVVTAANPTDATCGGGKKLIWKKVLVTSSSGPGGTDETLRFANWYSYYRNRMQMTKSAIGRAFLPLVAKKKYRAGFITIAPDQLEGVVPAQVPPNYHAVYPYDAAAPQNSKFLEIRDFDTEDTSTNQPYRWFRTLYAQRANGQTPLREGLARVGRYYAGKNDGPNAGMIPNNSYDPVQYACQQNYAILTTDGYWDSPTTSIGGFKLDYTVPMDNQDGNITETVSYVDSKGVSHVVAIGARPIYDGTVTSTATTTDANNAYRRIACDYWLQSTQQILQSTVQPLRSTRQVFGWTQQAFASTAQVIRNRRQEFYSTQQRFAWTALPFMNTSQRFRRTYVENALTSQLTTYNLWVTKDTLQLLSSTTQQFYNTKEQRPVTLQRWTNNINVTKYTSQDWRRTVQRQSGTLQRFSRTEQRFASTMQRFVRTDQSIRSTRQIVRCGPNLTACDTPVAVGGVDNEFVTYTTVTTGPASTSACVAGTDTSTWITTTCSTVTTGPTSTSACVAGTDTSTWVTTSCSTLTTGPASTAAASCTASTNTSTWVTSSCSTSTVAFASVASCTAGTDTSTWVTTVCSTSTVPATGVTSCTASTNASTWVTTTCSTVSTGPTSFSLCTAGTDTSTWVTTTCSTSTSTLAVASCTASTNTSTWVTTTCSISTTSLSSIATCAASTNTSTWVTTTCSISTTTLAAVASCAASTNTSTWITTTCSTITTGPSITATCIASTNTGTWVTTTCSISTTTTQPVASCVAGTNAGTWVTTICSTVTTGTSNVAAATCTPSTDNTTWITTMCSTTTSTVTVVPSTCTPAAGNSGNNWVTTVCATITNTTPVSTCVAAAASAGNSWIATTCASTVTGFTSINACAPITASAGNGWLTTTCSTSTTGPTSVSSCAPTTTASWVTTTCSTSTSTTNAAATCTPSTNATSWVTTVCSTTNVGPSSIASCAASTNTTSWVTTTCSVSTSSTSLAVCVASTNTSTWVTTTCSTVATGPTSIASCAAGTDGSTWVTTTCTTTIASASAVAACSASTDSGTWITTVCSTTTTGPTGVSACAPGTDTVTWITSTCSTATTTNVPVASCTPGTSASWVTTSCDTTSSTSNTTNVVVQSCAAAVAGSGNNYVSTTCLQQPGVKNQYQTQIRDTINRYNDTLLVGSTPYPAWSTPFPNAGSWIDFSLCLASVPAAWTGWPADYTGRPGATDPAGPTYPPATPYYQTFDAACTGWPCTHTNNTVTGGSTNTLADVAQYYYKTDLRSAGATGQGGVRDVSANKVPASATDTTEGDAAVWQHMTTFTMGLGVSGDVAYNKNYRLKPIGSYMASAGINPVTGVSSPIGTPLEPFQLIRCQDATNTLLGDPNLCLNWPVPIPLNPAYPVGNANRDPSPGTRVDDLWHAAVNGRGQYFSAADPEAVLTGLTNVLNEIGGQKGAGTGATTATQDPVPGNNLTFRASFRTVDWTGNIRAQPLYIGDDISLEGTIAGDDAWSAQIKLDGQVGVNCDNRNIYLLRVGATDNMVPFTWNSYACDGGGSPTGSVNNGLNASERNYFTSAGPAYVSPFPMSSWSQFIDMTDGTGTPATIDQRPLAQGAPLVNFLRGQKGMMDFASGNATKLFRNRLHVLGDIVGSQPRYVEAPNAQFTDIGYAGFKSIPTISGRARMLYVGANDGMLHAFNASIATPPGGFETWAVIPSTVLPNMYRLADTGYSEGHSYFVDATPSAGDVYDKHQTTPIVCNGAAADDAKNCWKTILVGGLGAGGRGYYAMDVTNPTSPKALWELKWSDTCYDPSVPATHYADCHLGLSFGSPLITKLVDGTWVALLPSGLNNVNAPAKAGDGQGYLYVLDAITGKILKKIGTGVGSATAATVALAGTLTLNGTTLVTGTSTSFTTALVQGQTIVVNGQARVVHTITDDTHLTVSMAFPSSANGTFSGTTVTGSGAAGFSYINAYVENYIQDNTTERVYGGDALGNVWRIDLKGATDTNDDVVRLATLLDPNGFPQPITTTPQLMNVGAAKTRMVYVGTGRYLGESDLSDTQTQTVYGLAEDLSMHSDSADYVANGHSVLPKVGLTLRQQLNQVVLSTVSGDANTRQASAPACSAAATAAGVGCSGWYADLPALGERVNLDMRLVLGSLIVPTNVTSLSECDTGGNSWLNVFDAATGGEVPGSPYKAGKYMSGSVTVGLSLIRGRSGRVYSVLTKSDDSQEVSPVQTQQGAPQGRRSGWRDLPDR